MTTTSVRRAVRVVAAVAGVAAAGAALPAAGQSHGLDSSSAGQQALAAADSVDVLPSDSAQTYRVELAAFEMPTVPSSTYTSRKHNNYDVDDNYSDRDANPINGRDGAFYSNGDSSHDGDNDSGDYDKNDKYKGRYRGETYSGLYNGTKKDRYEDEEKSGRRGNYLTDLFY